MEPPKIDRYSYNRTTYNRLFWVFMFIRAYLRASTKDQDANRAKDELIVFAREHGHKIAAFYTENESGAMLERPQLMQLIDDASFGLYK